MESSSPISVTVFGKIPTYGDFVQINCGGPIWQTFDRWFQNGVIGLRRELGAEFKPAMAASSPFNFLFTVRDAGGVVAGVVHPSRDSVGRFTFLIVASVNQIRPDLTLMAHMPAQLRAFYRDASSLASTAADGQLTTEDLGDRALRLPHALEPAQRLEDAQSRNWAISNQLSEMLRGLRPDQIARFKLAFRLPLVDADLEASIGSWMSLCLSMVGDPDETSPCVFWSNQSDGAVSAILAISEPSPNILLSVTGQSSDIEEIMDLTESSS